MIHADKPKNKDTHKVDHNVTPFLKKKFVFVMYHTTFHPNEAVKLLSFTKITKTNVTMWLLESARDLDGNLALPDLKYRYLHNIAVLETQAIVQYITET